MIIYAIFVMGIVLGCISSTPKWRVAIIYLAALSFSIGLLSSGIKVLFWNTVFFGVLSMFGYFSWAKEKFL